MHAPLAVANVVLARAVGATTFLAHVRHVAHLTCVFFGCSQFKIRPCWSVCLNARVHPLEERAARCFGIINGVCGVFFVLGRWAARTREVELAHEFRCTGTAYLPAVRAELRMRARVGAKVGVIGIVRVNACK